MVIAPCSRMGPVSDDERNGLLNHSPLYGKYEEEVDRESAFEMLQQGVQVATGQQSAPPAKGQQNGDDDGLLGGLKDILFGSTGPRGGKRDGIVQTAAKSAVRRHQSDRPRHAGQPAGRTQAQKALIAEGLTFQAYPLGLAHHQPEAYQEEAGARQQRADDRRYAVDRSAWAENLVEDIEDKAEANPRHHPHAHRHATQRAKDKRQRHQHHHRHRQRLEDFAPHIELVASRIWPLDLRYFT